MDTLAELYEAENKYAEAEPLLKRALAIREKAPGQPDVAASRERLATAYDKLGRSAEASTLRSAQAPGHEADAKKKAAEAKEQDQQQESAQAQQKDAPALTPLPRFSARRMARPADPSDRLVQRRSSGCGQRARGRCAAERGRRGNEAGRSRVGADGRSRG